MYNNYVKKMSNEDYCYICAETETDQMKFVESLPCTCEGTIKIHKLCYEYVRRSSKCGICQHSLPNDPIWLIDNSMKQNGLIFWQENNQAQKHGLELTYAMKENRYIIIKEFWYKNGKRDGPYKIWNKNGRLILDGAYKNHTSFTGCQRRYNIDGSFDFIDESGTWHTNNREIHV